MTREEQIKKAAFHECRQSNTAARFAFILGANWADKYPKNHWHKLSADDMPKDGEMVLILEDGYNKALLMKYPGENECVKNWMLSHIGEDMYWMPIPELPKED